MIDDDEAEPAPVAQPREAETVGAGHRLTPRPLAGPPRTPRSTRECLSGGAHVVGWSRSDPLVQACRAAQRIALPGPPGRPGVLTPGPPGARRCRGGRPRRTAPLRGPPAGGPAAAPTARAASARCRGGRRPPPRSRCPTAGRAGVGRLPRRGRSAAVWSPDQRPPPRRVGRRDDAHHGGVDHGAPRASTTSSRCGDGVSSAANHQVRSPRIRSADPRQLRASTASVATTTARPQWPLLGLDAPPRECRRPTPRSARPGATRRRAGRAGPAPEAGPQVFRAGTSAPAGGRTPPRSARGCRPGPRRGTARAPPGGAAR